MTELSVRFRGDKKDLALLPGYAKDSNKHTHPHTHYVHLYAHTQRVS
jgi:hypothetical protein